MNKQKIAVVGADGKMGRLICQRLSQKYHVVKITKKCKLKKNKNISLVIDFATADSSVQSAKWCKDHFVPLIVGSTGQTDEQNAEIESCSKVIPILKCSNFSVGIQMIFKVLKNLWLGDVNDITLIETHSKGKKDSPSGTAIEMRKILSENQTKPIQVLSERAGNGFGTHCIKLHFKSEIIELTHTALSREVFFDGLEKCIERVMNAKIAKMYQIEELIEK